MCQTKIRTPTNFGRSDLRIATNCREAGSRELEFPPTGGLGVCQTKIRTPTNFGRSDLRIATCWGGRGGGEAEFNLTPCQICIANEDNPPAV